MVYYYAKLFKEVHYLDIKQPSTKGALSVPSFLHIYRVINKRVVLENSLLQWEIVCRVALMELYLRIESELDFILGCP